jgi:Tol biopolymer transport system component
MQVYQKKLHSKYFFLILASLFLLILESSAQVNTVEFGQNRLQFKNFKWKFYQTPNFNSYFNQDGQPLGKFVAQLAEKELTGIEQFVEYGLQRRANIVIYNSYNEMHQSNIGLNLDWQTTGGITKLVNNKMIVYYTDDHNKLRIQIRQGIARILVENILFGDDLGEFAANQALLDLPQWLTDGYIEYVAENWNTDLDDQLKSAILSGRYDNFYNMAFEKPNLSGHAFWYYFAQKYKKENVTYFLYLARVYRNLNSASMRICKKKFKEVLKDFMAAEEDIYTKDIRGRRNFPKGSVSVVEQINDNKDFFRFSPNPAPRSQTYAVVEYKRGLYRVVLHENYVNTKVLLKSGVRANDKQMDPNYPMIAWDGKGTRLAVLYWSRGKIKLFVYDIVQKYKRTVTDLPEFSQVQDMKYMLDANTLLFSAVENGQSDIFVYNIEKGSTDQITNDIYDDIDATYASFPGKSGIIYSSNRPSGHAGTGDTVLPSNNRYNIFLVDNWNKSDFKQVTQLTRLRYGNARFPTQYNNFHFTFVCDENGISNRYAGFFTTQRAGVDTVYRIGDEILHNPDPKELDSVLSAQNKTAPDTVFAFSITNDSAYIFPITNYQSGLKETKIAGDNGQVSEVRQEGDLKFLYKLKVDEAALKKRNINPKLTDYRKQSITATQLSAGQALQFQQRPVLDTSKKQQDFFENGFEKEKTDSTAANRPVVQSESQRKEESVLSRAKLLDYKLKFSADNFTAGFNNDVLINKYQPYTGSLPIQMGGDAFDAMFKASVFDLFEDLRFTGALRLPLFGGSSATPVNNSASSNFVPGNSSFFDGSGEWYVRVDYLKRLFDYSLIYYRETQVGASLATVDSSTQAYFDAKSYTNLWQGVIKYPFDKVRSLRFSFGVRTDKIKLRPDGSSPTIDTLALSAPDQAKQTYGLTHLEYVYDNTVLKATNIWNGLRYKAYIDFNTQLNKPQLGEGRKMFNFGFDARNYFPIYRNFIWALRAAGDFSWGNQKIIYYLGGTDGWLFPKANQVAAAPDSYYGFQSLAVNLRGFNQNVANGNNAVIINSELRFPVFTTLFNKPINNAFLRNFELIQFFDLGSAWNGAYNKLSRPTEVYPSDGSSDLTVLIKAGGIGPFAGGYGFGARSTLLGYFLRLDCGWEMNSFFHSKPILQVSMGVDF